jgi:hypothetical protein
MFDFKHYLTMDLVADVVSEFRWPREYHLEDDLPDGIILSFPKSRFAFCRGRMTSSFGSFQMTPKVTLAFILATHC